MCAALPSALGRWFALSPRSVRRLLPVGAAAGVAAAFNAPIAAVTFTVEEIVGKLDQTVLSGVVVAAALAAVIEHSVLGSHPIFTLEHVAGLDDARALPLYALLGALAGVASVAFSRSLLGLRAWFARTRAPVWMRPGIGGLMTGACAIAAHAIVSSEGIAGGGYPQLSLSLRASLDAAQGLTALEQTAFSIAPVVDDVGRCLGLVSVARLRRVLAEGSEGKPLGERVRLREYVFADDPLLRAVVRMNAIGTRHLPVVAEGEPTLLGLVTMSDVFRLQAHVAGPDARPSPPSEHDPT